MGWGKPFSKNGWARKALSIAAPIAGTILGGPLGGAIGGALGGAVSLEGPKAIAGGAALGGLGGLLAGGAGAATSGFGSSLMSGAKGLLGTTAGTALSGSGVGPTMGSGLLGAATKGLSGVGLSGIGSSLGGAGKLLNYAMPAASIFSGLQQSSAIKDIEEQKLEAERQRMAQMQPYNVTGQAANESLAAKLASGELGGQFNALDLSSDPVYQSELAQGEQALGRKASASGNVFSGQALKEATEYSQNLAQQKQNEAYNRWLGQQQNTYNQLAGQSSQGMNAAAGVGNIYSGMGDITAGATGAQSNNLNQTLAQLLAGSGAKTPTVDEYGRIVYV